MSEERTPEHVYPHPYLCAVADCPSYFRNYLPAPPDSEAVLDVERLAQAYHMSQLCEHGVGAGDPMQTPGYLRPDRERAAVIANEYARLAASGEREKDEEPGPWNMIR